MHAYFFFAQRLSERYSRREGLDEDSSQDEEEASVSVHEMVRRWVS